MIVLRNVVKTKQGHLDEAIALFKTELERIWPDVPVRFYRIETGKLDRFAVELEAESLADLELQMADWMAQVSSEWYESWKKVTRSGGKTEIWSLA